MLTERIYFNDDKDVYLDVYVADKVETFARNAILVIPGGGYWLCSSREAEPIGLAFMPHGFNAFVLNYSVRSTGSKNIYPQQLIEASMAMKHIKDNAERYNIDPEKIFVCGFSAGGHLAASLGTKWYIKEIYDAIDMPYGYNKPKGMILGYPVISVHYGSYANVFNVTDPTEEMFEKAGIVNYVDERACEAFIFHTSNDQTVPVVNALDIAAALSKAGKQFEMHIYPDAPHGIALANELTMENEPKYNNPRIARWVLDAATWAKGLE